MSLAEVGRRETRTNAGIPRQPRHPATDTHIFVAVVQTQTLHAVATHGITRRTNERAKQPDACAPGGAGGGADGESKAALMRKALHDKGWAEKQAAGFTTWLNFNLVGAEQMRHGGDADGGGDDGEMEGFAREAGGVSSSPLKAMFAMVRAVLWCGAVRCDQTHDLRWATCTVDESFLLRSRMLFQCFCSSFFFFFFNCWRLAGFGSPPDLR